MNVIYSDMEPNFDLPSIFLAGPTYRSGQKVVEGSYWRDDAEGILDNYKFKGTLFVPIRQDGDYRGGYLDQVEWEYECMEKCSVIVFWIPRNKTELVGLTTNVEFGRYLANPKTLYGRPPTADSVKYLDWIYTKLNGNVVFMDMPSLLKAACNKIRKQNI